MEGFENLWEKFSLTTLKESGFDLNPLTKPDGGMLLGRFLTRKVVNVESAARTFRPLWRSVKGFNIRDLGNNRMVFYFQDHVDIERVLARC